MLFDQREQAFGIEARRKHDALAGQRGAQAEGIGRGMIERAGDRRDHVGREAVDGPAHPGRFFHLFRRRGIAAHRLGISGRAGCVDHAVGCGRRQVFGSRMRMNPGVPVLRFGRRDAIPWTHAIGRGQFLRRRHDEDMDAGWNDMRDDWPEVCVHDEGARAAIVQNVFDLFRLEMPVDRHGIGADPLSGERGLEEGEIVAQKERDRIAACDADVAKALRGAGCALVEFGAGHAAIAADEAVYNSSGHGLLVLDCAFS